MTDRIPYGQESMDWSRENCHDCGADRGELHLPGCDAEECPVCGGQLIGCEHGRAILAEVDS